MERSRQKNIIKRKADSIMWWFLLIMIFVIAPLSWLTHVFSTIANEQWLLLIAGAILVPIGMIHGIGIWLGIY